MLKPERIDKVYFYIGEVAQVTGVKTSALRFYEEQFFIEIKKRNAKGERLFSKSDLKKFKWIVRACAVYKLQVVKLALLSLPPQRFQREELLSNEEQQAILNQLNNEIRTPGRQSTDPAGPTR